MRGHGRAGYARGSRAGPQHVPQDALDKKKPSFRLEGDSSPRQALRLPVIRSIWTAARIMRKVRHEYDKIAHVRPLATL